MFLEVLAAIGVACGAALGLIAVAVKFGKAGKRFKDWWYSDIKEHIGVVKLERQFAEMLARVDAIHQEVTINGGTSMKDLVQGDSEVIARIDERQAHILIRLGDVEQQVERVITEELTQLETLVNHLEQGDTE